MSLLGPNWEDMCRPTQTLHHPIEMHDSLGRLYPHTDSGVCGMWCMHVYMFTSTQELVGQCISPPSLLPYTIVSPETWMELPN